MMCAGCKLEPFGLDDHRWDFRSYPPDGFTLKSSGLTRLGILFSCAVDDRSQFANTAMQVIIWMLRRAEGGCHAPSG